IGSTFVARRAGIQQAKKATKASISAISIVNQKKYGKNLNYMRMSWFKAVKGLIAISICIVFVSLTSNAQEKQVKEIKLFPILLNNRIGFIDIAGKIVAEPRFYPLAFFLMRWDGCREFGRAGEIAI